MEKQRAVKEQVEIFNERFSKKFTKFYTHRFKPLLEAGKQIRESRRSHDVKTTKLVKQPECRVSVPTKYRAPPPVPIKQIDECLVELDLCQ